MQLHTVSLKGLTLFPSWLLSGCTVDYRHPLHYSAEDTHLYIKSAAAAAQHHMPWGGIVLGNE